ncbi:MAG: ATP-dependent DNA helicase RecG, partial [Candidatus Omnitrophica bacterium]|nr:ATP-dependent DNA helicase RecG [Candidatus Omnitrophota bacterium]MBD3269696.1 ATP-dependent DNA helicase RecG [Candidatus Omnitrophota bacterium]
SQLPVRYIKGVGPRREKLFNNLGVWAADDLLRYFPFRYQDKRNFVKVEGLKEGVFAAVEGIVCKVRYKQIPYFLTSRRVRHIFEIVLGDDTGKIKCVWFNQKYLTGIIKEGDKLIVYGKPSLYKGVFQIISPEFTTSKDKDDINVGRIVGTYRLPKELRQRFMRRIISGILDKYARDYQDPIPFHIRKKRNLLNIRESFSEIHFPSSWDKAAQARERFIFEELFLSQVLVYLRKARHTYQEGVPLKINEGWIEKIKKGLEFELTPFQDKAVHDIFRDMSKPYPMHRLLQGDVGCGKTVVAAFAAAFCLSCGWQVAFMVPTEVLAFQHTRTLSRFFKGLGFEEDGIKALTSSVSQKEKENIYKYLGNGKLKLVIGTHSLLQEKVKFKNLGLVIIDEQHKFGVAQRALLPKKSVLSPHCLVMSATPIPRSLALSLYGDLDLSVIKEMPAGRVSPDTIWVQEDKRAWVYDFIEGELRKKRQAYIVYPLIEEGEEEEIRSLKQMQRELAKRFSSFSLGVFHGKMKNEEKMATIEKFRNQKIKLLISTNVIEVGVNIENATVMVVENPERFGLAQLHQLRGRIQRSHHKPFFILISNDSISSLARQRLETIKEERDGFKIAEEDLKIRGPGDFFGNIQHGLPDLSVANPVKDLDVLKQARFFAYNTVKYDPYLKKTSNRYLREYLEIRFKGHFSFREHIDTGSKKSL